MAREMKESGVEWIGRIPASWEMSRLLWCLEEIKEKNNPIKTTNVLSLTNKLGVVPYEERGNQGNKAKEDYSQYGLAFENTLVINSMNVLIGSVGISKYYGCVSPVYYVYKNTDKADLRFINYIFQNTGFQKELRRYANGILEIRMRISSHDMLRRTIPLPQLSEQKLISDFLDIECNRIDAVIEQTRASIEEYKKLKITVITQAVTKGIHAERSMKHTEIEWVNSIPTDWDVISIGRLFTFIGGYAFSSDRFCEQTEYQVVRMGNIKDDCLLLAEKSVFIDEEYANGAEAFRIRPEDILFTMTGTKGKKDYFYTLLVSEEDTKSANLFINQRVGCFRKKEDCDMRYYNYLLKVPELKEFVFLFETGTANQGNLGIATIRKTRLPFPPLVEQKEIADYLEANCKKLDAVIRKKEVLVEELEAYKKALIFEYVTGKKEVPA